jgi:radical SAM superfamily enzyme YgiQ (UPF0313 family)
MKRKIAVIAPLIDESHFNLDFTLRLKDNNEELSIARLHQIFSNEKGHASMAYNYDDDIPAAGYYLQGVLRLNGYDTILTNRYDKATLRSIANSDVFAVCVSTTMILQPWSFISLMHTIEEELPGVPIISGGMFLWKQYLQYERVRTNSMEAGNGHSSSGDTQESSALTLNFFHNDSTLSPSNIMVVSPHGILSMMRVLKLLEKGSTADFSDVPNLCLPRPGGFNYTQRVEEEIDYNNDFTRWDFADEIPDKVKLRTSVGCPYRCGFCDFCTLFPRIFLRTPESINNELRMIRDGSRGKAVVINVTDDNVFINSRRLFEVCDILANSGFANWMGFMRANVYTPDELKAISGSGLRMSLLGIESGDQQQLDRMKKHQDAARMSRGIAQLDDLGIMTLLFFVVGYPGETDQTLENTANFLRNLELPNYLTSYHVYPLIIMGLAYVAEQEAREKWNIKGSLANWSHYTMNSSQAVESCYRLFRMVDNIPYHYLTESYFFNRGMFSRNQLIDLYKLRHSLTLSLIDGAGKEQQQQLLERMAGVMGIQSANTDLNLIVNAEL